MGGCCAESRTVGSVAMVVLCFFMGWLVFCETTRHASCPRSGQKTSDRNWWWKLVWKLRWKFAGAIGVEIAVELRGVNFAVDFLWADAQVFHDPRFAAFLVFFFLVVPRFHITKFFTPISRHFHDVFHDVSHSSFHVVFTASLRHHLG